MKKNLLLLASLAMLPLVSCGGNNTPVATLDHTYGSAITKTTGDSGYPGVVIETSTYYSLSAYSDNSYILTYAYSMNLSGMTGTDGDNMMDGRYTFYGTFTTTSSVYTLSTPTRVVSDSKVLKGYDAYMSDGHIDTDDSTTYQEDYKTKDEQLDALKGYSLKTVTVEETTSFIVSFTK